MIIFGFRSRGGTIAMLNLACRNGHIAAHRLVKVTRWFTVFFIPLIPFSRKYYTVCAQCGTQVTWSKADADAAAANAPLANASPPGDPVAQPLPNTFTSAPPVASGPPAGWYPESEGSDRQRYWNGSAWSDADHDA